MNFNSGSCRCQTDQGTSSHFTEYVKCFKCGKIGRRQSESRAKVSAIVCYVCGEKGHKPNECPKKKTGATRETAQSKRFYTKRNESNLTAEKQGFSFHTIQVNSTCKNIELLIDSGCTSHIIKNAELFRDLGKVECANGTESSIEGRRSVNSLAKDNQGQDKILELEQSLYVPQYTRMTKLENVTVESFSQKTPTKMFFPCTATVNKMSKALKTKLFFETNSFKLVKNRV